MTRIEMIPGFEVGARTYSADDQAWFAHVSRDSNPVHVDPIYARRAPSGQPIVHGIHLLIVALELALSNRALDRIGQLRMKFSQTVYVGDCVRFYLDDRKGRVCISAAVGDAICATFDVSGSEDRSAMSTMGSEDAQSTYRIGAGDHVELRALDFNAMSNAGGCITPSDDKSVDCRFPLLLSALGRSRVQGLLVLSCVVGMLCPGLYSIFSAANLSFEGPDDPMLRVVVRSTDDRFRLVVQQVCGLGLSGSIEAFARVPPIVQPSVDELRGLVKDGEFRGCHALVIGGSRGLGEIAAKLIAAGGGDVTITFATGAADAARVVESIREDCFVECHAVSYDACRDDPGGLLRSCPPISHLLYFATFKIGERRRPSFFSESAFERYTDIYVAAFARLLEACRANGLTNLRVLYPSSSAVESPPSGFYEYAMAKAAGETFCRFLERDKHFVFSVPRYPRLLTDQTATVVPTQTKPAAETVLSSIRDLQHSGEKKLDGLAYP